MFDGWSTIKTGVAIDCGLPVSECMAWCVARGIVDAEAQRDILAMFRALDGTHAAHVNEERRRASEAAKRGR